MPEKSWVDTESPGTWWGGRRIGIIHKTDLDSFFAVPLVVAAVNFSSVVAGKGKIECEGTCSLAAGEDLSFMITIVATDKATGKDTKLPPSATYTPDKTGRAGTWKATLLCPAATYNPTTVKLTPSIGGPGVTATNKNTKDQVVN